MALKFPIKINNVTNLSDARYCAGMDVALLGISNNLPIDEFTAIVNWITGIELCLDIADDNNQLNDYLSVYPFQFVESSNIETLKNLNIPNKILRINELDFATINSICKQNQHKVSNFNIAIKDLSFDEIIELSSQFNIIASTSKYDKNQIDELLELKKLGYIGLYGGEELAPGLKSFDEIAEILEYLEIID